MPGGCGVGFHGVYGELMRVKEFSDLCGKRFTTILIFSMM